MHRIATFAAGAALLIGLFPASASGATTAVGMTASAFTPASITITAGDTVTWQNSSAVAHTVTARDGSFNSGTMQPGATFSRTFQTPGTYTYDCLFHNGMTGTVTVVAASASGSATASGTSGTATALSAQAEALLAQVKLLQQQLGAAQGASITGSTAATSAACPQIGRSLKRGVSGDDVARLQQFLASDPTVYPEGIVSGYFGVLTEAAVMRFQTKQNVVSSGSPETTGYGVVGPRTVAAIAHVCGGITGGTGSTPASSIPTVGGFIQVSPVSGNAPLTVNVVATVNTVSSCVGATYTLDWGDGSVAQSITVPAGSCGQVQQTYAHMYIYGGVYTVRLSAGGHQTSATVVVSGPTATQ